MTNTEGQQIRVVLADDEPLVRVGLGLIIDGEPDLTMVGEAGDGQEAIEVAAAAHADVVVMDVRCLELTVCMPSGSWSAMPSWPKPASRRRS